MAQQLQRTLGLSDAVTIGLGSMIGAGVFAVWGPATASAGGLVLVALLIAAVVAVCNALSSAALAARYPSAGGTYVYGRERLGPFWGYLAGWCFVIGKTASCAAMAMVVGAYLVPDAARQAAVMAVVLNLWFNELRFARQKPGSSVFTEADRYIDLSEALALRHHLREGDRVEGGRLIDQDGTPVPVRDADGQEVQLPVEGEERPAGEH